MPFALLFTAPTWAHVQVLLTGTLLAQGPRTVAAALRTMGLAHERRCERYHRVLSRARWSGLRGAQIPLGLSMRLLPPGWPLVVAVNETLERRTGARIAAIGKLTRGEYTAKTGEVRENWTLLCDSLICAKSARPANGQRKPEQSAPACGFDWD